LQPALTHYAFENFPEDNTVPNVSNGYKEPGQNIVQYAIEEQKIPFATVAKNGAAAVEVKGWIADYKSAQGISISTGLLGAFGVVGAIATIGPATIFAAAAGTVAIGGFVTSYLHSLGVKSNRIELEMLRQYPEILESLSHAVTSGLPSGVAVSVYSQCLARHSLDRPIDAVAYREMLSAATNDSIARWKTSQTTSEAFVAGEEIPMLDNWDEEDDDSGDTGFGNPVPATDDHLPAFLRSAAVPVASTAVASSPKSNGAAPQLQSAPTAVATPDRTAIDDMVKPLRSSYVAAPPRTGKGVMVAMGLRECKRLYPEMTLYTYTPKQDPKEDWYWTPSDSHYNPDLGNNLVRPGQQLYKMIRQWQALDGTPTAPLLFVFDELSVTLAKFKSVLMADVDPELFTGDKRTMSAWLLEFIIHEASMRQSVDRFIWCMTPLSTVGESGVSKSAIGSLKNYTLASRESRKFADGGSSAFSAPHIDTDHPLLQRYFTIAWSHDTLKWLGVPTVGQSTLDKAAASNPKLNYWQTDTVNPALDLVMNTIAAQALAQVVQEQEEEVDQVLVQMRAVYAYLVKRDHPMDKRAIQRGDLKALKGCKADDIAALLEMMQDEGYLQSQHGNYTPNPNKQP
jgi:hypothetical protein